MSDIEHDADTFEPDASQPAGEREQTQSDRRRAVRVAALADRGFREQPFKRESAPAAVSVLLVGLVPAHAREERGAA